MTTEMANWRSARGPGGAHLDGFFVLATFCYFTALGVSDADDDLNF